MSTGLSWYRRYPSDFIGGTRELSLEEKGAYSIALDLMYERGGPIPDEPKWIARVCGCPLQRWKKIRARLISVGKLNLTDDGRLANGRATYEMQRDRIKSDAFSAAAKREGQPKAAKNLKETSKKLATLLAKSPQEMNENKGLKKPSRAYSESQKGRDKGSLPAARPPEGGGPSAELPSEAAADPPPAASKVTPPPKPKSRLQEFRDDMAPRLQAATGWPLAECYKILGRALKDATWSLPTVEHAVERLEEVRPKDPGPFFFGAISAKLHKRPAWDDEGSDWQPGL